MAKQQVSIRCSLARPLVRRWMLVLLLGCQSVFAAEVAVREDSPTRYTVLQGDTLWDIAGKFLEEPWLWPEVWQLNPQIENPDLIYPGDIIELAYENGAPVLRLSRGAQDATGERGGSMATAAADLPTVRLSPQVRAEPILSPIPAIPLDRISAHLDDNYVIPASDFEAAPYLLGEVAGHALIGTGDEVYARGSWTDGTRAYDVVRRGRELQDPDTGAVVGIEALTVGAAELASINGERATLRITANDIEIRPGDRLVPRQSTMIQSRYLPAPPDFDVDAAIISIGTGREIGGMYDSLTINAGSDQGLAPGHLLQVREPSDFVRDHYGKTSPWQALRRAFGKDAGERLEFPGKPVATVLVYRVFAGASLALVLQSSDGIRPEDRVVTP